MSLSEQKNQLVHIMNTAYSRGWSWATGGNYSFLDGDGLWMSPSGVQKGGLSLSDLIKVNLNGEVIEGKGKASAEVLIHTFLVKEFGAKSVLHTHSVSNTILSMRKERSIILKGYEMLKALEGVETHQHREEILIFRNTQDIEGFIPELKNSLSANHHAFLLSGHGLYTWGSSMDVAFRQLEAFEFLFEVLLRGE